MSTSIFDFAASRTVRGQPLVKAARLALEADPTPRMVKIIVDHDGLPIEKTKDEPLQESLPFGVQED